MIEIKIEKFDSKDVPRKTLMNMGLLRIEAAEQTGKNIFTLNMVVHVSKDKQDESILKKTVLNPLE